MLIPKNVSTLESVNEEFDNIAYIYFFNLNMNRQK